jgi:hypothetical protein
MYKCVPSEGYRGSPAGQAIVRGGIKQAKLSLFSWQTKTVYVSRLQFVQQLYHNHESSAQTWYNREYRVCTQNVSKLCKPIKGKVTAIFTSTAGLRSRLKIFVIIGTGQSSVRYRHTSWLRRCVSMTGTQQCASIAMSGTHQTKKR